MTASVASPRTGAMLLLAAVQLLEDILQRARQCEEVCSDELAEFDDPELELLATRRAIHILRADVDRISQDCIANGLLDTSGDVAVSFEAIWDGPTGGAP